MYLKDISAKIIKLNYHLFKHREEQQSMSYLLVYTWGLLNVLMKEGLKRATPCFLFIITNQVDLKQQRKEAHLCFVEDVPKVKV